MVVRKHVVGLVDLAVIVTGAVLPGHTLACVAEEEAAGTETALLTHTHTLALRQGQGAARLVAHTPTQSSHS